MLDSISIDMISHGGCGEADDFFFSSRRRHTRFDCDWSSDVCSSDLALEGRLAGPWVDELRASWRSLATTRDARSIRVDLDAVTFVDTAGKALLWAMHQQGAVLTATGCMTRAILDEIRKNAHERGGRMTVGNGDDRWNT